MSTPTTKTEVTRSLGVKTGEKFYVSFFGMPENLSNILGREVQSVSRPNLTFNEYEIRNKGRKVTGHGYIDYQPIDVVFYDDSTSLISRALYEQVKLQTGVNSSDGNTIRFRMQCKVYSIADEHVEDFTIMDCHILSIGHSEFLVQDTPKQIITVSITFNDLCYAHPVLDV